MVSNSDQHAGGSAVTALTTLSPIRPERLGPLRRRLAFVATAPGVGRPLLDLTMIHRGRWVVFDSLPDPKGGDRRWRLNWPYLLFAATYDGPDPVYLNTFADILPTRLIAIFGDCVGFESHVMSGPGSDVSPIPADAFRDWVHANRIGELGTFAAVSDRVDTILQALAIKRTVARSDGMTGAKLDRAQRDVRAMALGPPSRPPGIAAAVDVQWSRLLRPRHAVNPLTIIAPLKEGAKLPEDPWADLPDSTLFARLVKLPKTMQEDLGHQHPDRLPVEYLVMAFDHYGSQAEYIDSLRKSSSVQAVFEACVKFRGTAYRAGFKKWIAKHSLRTQYYFAGYPTPPIKELKELLKARRTMADWSLDILAAPTPSPS
jgi:hypothetical protein